MQLDFGEAGQQKSVTIVELEPGRPAKALEVQLEEGRKLLDVETELDALDAVEVDPDAYLRIFLECDGPAPGLVDRVRDVLGENVVEVRLDLRTRGSGAARCRAEANEPGRTLRALLPKTTRVGA